MSGEPAREANADIPGHLAARPHGSTANHGPMNGSSRPDDASTEAAVTGARLTGGGLSDGGARRRYLRGLLVRSLGIGLFLAVVIVYFTLTTSTFLSLSNMADILSGVAVLGIVAIGQTGVIISGGFDLSVAGVLPLACVLFVKFSNSGASLPVALVETLALGVVVGIINAVLILRAGINPLIVTLASLSVAGGAAYSISGGTVIALSRIGNGALANLAIGSLPWYLFAFLALAIVATVIMRFTVFGRIIYALGGSREASVLAGIRVNLAATAVYAISGGLAAFAGVVTASQILAGSAGVGSTTALMSVAAVVLGGAALTGGTGGIVGTIGGVLVLGCLSNGLALMQVQSFYVQIITGIALIVAVMFSRLNQILSR